LLVPVVQRGANLAKNPPECRYCAGFALNNGERLSEPECLAPQHGVEPRFTADLSDQEISARAARQDLWLWPLSTCYAGTNVRQGFILGFGSTKAADMALLVERLRQVITA
jgi:hypothetical protein